jgi:hypothetical protein
MDVPGKLRTTQLQAGGKNMAALRLDDPEAVRTALKPLNRFFGIVSALVAVGFLIAYIASRDLNLLVGVVGGGLSAWACYLKGKY